MGSGIAGVFARSGCEVALVDIDKDSLRRGMTMLRDAQQGLIKAKLLSESDATAALERVAALTSLESACSGVHLLVEAVTENLALKRRMFRRFDELCANSVVMATNTSGLSITKIAKSTKRPEHVAGMHFWYPPHIIPLVEVVKGECTAASTAQLLIEMCVRLNKRPILVHHDVPGFVGNRLQFAVLREALHLLSQGIASAEDIDAAMTTGPGLRYALLGPLRGGDLGGLDVFHAISKYLFSELSRATNPPALLTALAQEGKLGAKTGQGFYRYSEEDIKQITARRDRVLLEFLRVLKNGEGV
jgi:3-hydroxybutyryl-CoA dehydrogenase